MTQVHCFSKSLKIGELGEEIIKDWFARSTNITNVIDVRKEVIYQDIDVDFILKMTNGKEHKIEIKTDTYMSGNIYYETISAEETNSIGCFEKTQADYLFYYFINLSTLYILEMDRYREWFNEQKNAFDEKGYQKKPKNARWNGTQYTSVGYAFPVKLLEDLNPKWMRRVYISQ